MIDYFEASGQKVLYDKLSDYEKGYIDGLLLIADKVEKEFNIYTEDDLEEYIEEYIEANGNCPPQGCNTLDECAEIFAYDFLMYYEEATYDLLTRDYLRTIAGFLGVDMPEEYEEADGCETFIEFEEEYASGLMFYITSQAKLHPLLNEYQNGVIAAYTSLLSMLDMNIRTHLETDDEMAINLVKQDILSVLEGNIDLPIENDTPVFMSVLEEVYPIFLSANLMSCCMNHISDMCKDEYMYFVSRFANVEYDEVLDTCIE